MGFRALQHCITFLLLFTLSSGSDMMRPLLNRVNHDRILDKQEKKIFFSSSVSAAKFDATTSIPIVNPSPDAATPIDNPSSPPAPAFAQPTTPTAPTVPQMPPTLPTTLPPIPPATPMTPQNPTTPATPQSPTTIPLTPESPTTTPTTPQSPTSTTPTSSGGGSWCVAKPNASPNALQVGLDYACGFGGAECSAIQPGASCYNPNTVKDHASYAFNSYYHKHPGPNSCDFGGIAQLTNTDPSTGNCHYTSSTSSSGTPLGNSGTTPPTNSEITPPAGLSPPGSPTMTTPTSTFPGGSTDFGGEPTGLPSSANSKLCCTLLLIISLLGAILPTCYI